MIRKNKFTINEKASEIINLISKDIVANSIGRSGSGEYVEAQWEIEISDGGTVFFKIKEGSEKTRGVVVNLSLSLEALRAITDFALDKALYKL